MIVHIFISLLTMFGNVLVCTAFIKDPYQLLRTLQKYYIMSFRIFIPPRYYIVKNRGHSIGYLSSIYVMVQIVQL